MEAWPAGFSAVESCIPQPSLIARASSATFQGPFGPFSGGRSYAEDMDRDATAWTRIRTCVAGVTSYVSRRSLLTIIGVLAAGSLWVITAAPVAVAFALTVAVAAAWGAWLEKHPEPPVDGDEVD